MTTQRELRDRLGEALHRMANFDDPKRWTKESPPLLPDRFYLSEGSKKEWRGQADRLLKEIGPDCGLRISC